VFGVPLTRLWLSLGEAVRRQMCLRPPLGAYDLTRVCEKQKPLRARATKPPRLSSFPGEIVRLPLSLSHFIHSPLVGKPTYCVYCTYARVCIAFSLRVERVLSTPSRGSCVAWLRRCDDRSAPPCALNALTRARAWPSLTRIIWMKEDRRPRRPTPPTTRDRNDAFATRLVSPRATRHAPRATPPPGGLNLRRQAASRAPRVDATRGVSPRDVCMYAFPARTHARTHARRYIHTYPRLRTSFSPTSVATPSAAIRGRSMRTHLRDAAPRPSARPRGRHKPRDPPRPCGKRGAASGSPLLEKIRARTSPGTLRASLSPLLPVARESSHGARRVNAACEHKHDEPHPHVRCLIPTSRRFSHRVTSEPPRSRRDDHDADSDSDGDRDQRPNKSNPHHTHKGLRVVEGRTGPEFRRSPLPPPAFGNNQATTQRAVDDRRLLLHATARVPRLASPRLAPPASTTTLVLELQTPVASRKGFQTARCEPESDAAP